MGGYGQGSSDYPVGHTDSAIVFSLLRTLIRWHQGDCRHPQDHGRGAYWRSRDRGKAVYRWWRRGANTQWLTRRGIQRSVFSSLPEFSVQIAHIRLPGFGCSCCVRANAAEQSRCPLCFFALYPTYHCGFASVSCSYANLHCGLNIAIAGLRFSTRFFITFGGAPGE